MDAKVVNPFLLSTVNLFKEMFSIEATPGKPYVITDLGSHKWEITGLLGITGDAQGIIAIRLTRLFADKLLEKSGVEVHSEDERKDMVDGLIGELTNIISGNASNQMNDLNVEISPPVVVSGANHQIAWPKIAPVVGIPFTTTFGPFEVDVCFKA